MFALEIVVLLVPLHAVRPHAVDVTFASFGFGATLYVTVDPALAIYRVKAIRICRSPLQMPRKTDFVLGLETVLNNPQTSFMHNPKVFNELYKQTGMSMNSMMKHIGKQSKNRKQKEPTDAEKSEARLNQMEASATKS